MKFRLVARDRDFDRDLRKLRGLSMKRAAQRNPQVARWLAQRYYTAALDNAQYRRHGKWYCKHAPVRRSLCPEDLERANEAVGWDASTPADPNEDAAPDVAQDQGADGDDEASDQEEVDVDESSEDEAEEQEDDDFIVVDNEPTDESSEEEDEQEDEADDESSDEEFSTDESSDDESSDDESSDEEDEEDEQADDEADDEERRELVFHVGKRYERHWDSVEGWRTFKVIKRPYTWTDGSIWARVRFDDNGETKDIELDDHKHAYRTLARRR